MTSLPEASGASQRYSRMEQDGEGQVSVPQDLRYSKEHEWVRLDGDTATIGITHFAQEQLGHERLVLEQRLKRALAHLGLVRRVRG